MSEKTERQTPVAENCGGITRRQFLARGTAFAFAAMIAGLSSSGYPRWLRRGLGFRDAQVLAVLFARRGRPRAEQVVQGHGRGVEQGERDPS